MTRATKPLLPAAIECACGGSLLRGWGKRYRCAECGMQFKATLSLGAAKKPGLSLPEWPENPYVSLQKRATILATWGRWMAEHTGRVRTSHCDHEPRQIRVAHAFHIPKGFEGLSR